MTALGPKAALPVRRFRWIETSATPRDPIAGFTAQEAVQGEKVTEPPGASRAPAVTAIGRAALTRTRRVHRRLRRAWRTPNIIKVPACLLGALGLMKIFVLVAPWSPTAWFVAALILLVPAMIHHRDRWVPGTPGSVPDVRRALAIRSVAGAVASLGAKAEVAMNVRSQTGLPS